MQDITIIYNTQNATKDQRKSDITALIQAVNNAQNALRQAKSTYEQIERIFNVINAVTIERNALEQDILSIDDERNAAREASLQTQLKTIDVQIKKNQLLSEENILLEKRVELTSQKPFEIVPGLSSGIQNLAARRRKAEQRREEETTTFIPRRGTAPQEQVAKLMSQVATITPQTVIAEQKTAALEQKTIVAEQTDTYKNQVHTLQAVTVTAEQINRELEKQSDLTDLINAGIERRSTAETVHLPAYFRQPVHPVQLSADHPDNRRPTVQRPASIVTDTVQRPAPIVTDTVRRPTTAQREVNTEVRELPTHIQSVVNTLSNVPSDTLSAAYDALIAIPAQTREALQQLKADTQQNILEIKNSEVLSAREKAKQIEEIEKNAAERREAIEQEASQAKINAFNRVVDNFIGGIGRMIAEQVKLRVATSLTNTLLGSSQGGAGVGGLLGSVVPFLAANPALAIGGGLALGAAALFSSSFDDPVNDALARRAGVQASQRRAAHAATALGRRSAVDLRDNFEQGFVSETTRQTTAPRGDATAAPVIMNEIKLIIGAQELKAMYEETQRQITTGVIAR